MNGDPRLLSCLYYYSMPILLVLLGGPWRTA